jgi:hypothetical protein
MLDPVNEVFLRDARFGCHEYGVIAADVADDLGPVAAIKRQSYALCRANCGSYDEQIRTCRLNAAQQLCDRSELIIIVMASGRQFIAGRRLNGGKLPKVSADARLGCVVAFRRQRRDDKALRFGRTLQQQLSYRFSALFVISVWHRTSRISMRII